MGRKREHIAPSLKIDLDGNLISEKKEKDANELTLLQTIERVVELSKDSELDDEFLAVLTASIMATWLVISIWAM